MKFKATPVAFEKRDKERLRKVAPVHLECSNETLAHIAAIRLYRMMQIDVRFVRVEEYRPKMTICCRQDLCGGALSRSRARAITSNSLKLHRIISNGIVEYIGFVPQP